MKVTGSGEGFPKGLRGVDLHVVAEEGEPVAQFAAYVEGFLMTPGGDAKVRLGIPFDQVPRVMPVMQHVGGMQFLVTVQRVPLENLPGSAW